MNKQNEPEPDAASPEVAFYYPGWIWRSDEAVKNLLLFFDGVALLVPEYMKERPGAIVPEIAEPLLDAGLLHILEPEKVVDKPATEKLVGALTDVITSGALDSLGTEHTHFRELSYSRLGGFGDAELARMIVEELKVRGLARDTEDGVSVPLHPMVHSLVLVLLAQILVPHGRQLGLVLEPATDRADLVKALTEFLSLPSVPSAGNVVATDMEIVGVDLGSVPLDEVLSYRTAHQKDYRAYRLAIRRFVRDLSLLPPRDRAAALIDRGEEIEDLARDIKRRSRKAWKQPASFGLSIAGAAWSATSGDPIGLIIGTGATLLGCVGSTPVDCGAYSYLFRVADLYA